MERLIKLIEKRKEIGKRKSYAKGGDHNDYCEYNRIGELISGKYEVTALDAGRLIVTQVKWQPKLKSWNLTGAMAYWKITAWKPLTEPYRPNKCHRCFGAASNDCGRCSG